jgi:hypothetical protein
MSNSICLPQLSLITLIIGLTGIIFSLGYVTFRFFILNIHQFLVKNAPIDADILVVEGWLPDYAIAAALHKFQEGSYLKIVTVGGLIQRGSYLFPYENFADLAAATLQAMGLDAEKVLAIPFNVVDNHRTQGSATDLQRWLAITDLPIKSINLVTLGVHSRRSWLLFHQVLEPRIKIGIISIEPQHYEPNQWWKSSEASRTIISESIAYLHIRLSAMQFGADS